MTFRIALLGAECTGKTRLAERLAEALREHTGQRVAWVDEWLRHWCEQAARTPRADEQRAIADRQMARIDAAAQHADWVVADTTALMTAVYSEHIFGDTSLTAQALAQQRAFDLTLVAAPDLPWVADGIQRDGPATRIAVDQRLRALLDGAGLQWIEVRGEGEARVAAALRAVATLPSFSGRTPPAGPPCP